VSEEQSGKRTGVCTALQALGHEYDHYDPDFALDPHADYAALRATCPVARTENYGGFYVMTKFDDIATVLHDAQTFSSWPADTPPTPGHTRALIPLEVDAPEHRRYRTIVDPLFRPKAIEHIADSVREYAIQLVDNMLDKREFDFMAEFAQPFPSSVFLRLVGLDFNVSHGDIEAQTAARLGAGKALNDFLRSLLDERLENPGEDIISYLTTAEMPGQRKLEYREILNFAYVLVLAGLDTVTTAIGFGFLHLARRPDLQDRLAENPALIPAAVEELLRYEPIVHASRTVTEPAVINGVQLLPGDRVVVPLASAHRDEDAYPQADQILLDRPAQKSMVFGAGSHRCLGSHLARLELTIAFEEILRRIPRFSLSENAQLAAYGGQTRSLAVLPFRTWRD